MLSRRLDVLRTEWPAHRPVAGWRVAVARDRAFFRAAKCEVATESAGSTHGRAPPVPPWERLNIPITPCEVLAISSPPIRNRLVLEQTFTVVCLPFPRQLGDSLKELHLPRRRGSPARVHSRGANHPLPAAFDDGSELIASIPPPPNAVTGPTTPGSVCLGFWAPCRPGERQRTSRRPQRFQACRAR